MQLYLYTGNHGKKDGIQEFIGIFRQVAGRLGYEVKITQRLMAGQVNLLIDEFSNRYENEKLTRFKREHPDSIIILVLTEFAETKYGVRSLNHFGSLFDAALISAINVVLRLKRADFNRPRPRDWFGLTLFSPILFGYGIWIGMHWLFSILRFGGKSQGFSGLIWQRLHRLAYFHIRYLGLEKYIGLADRILVSHECIVIGLKKLGWLIDDDSRIFGVLYPEFDAEQVLRKIRGKKSPVMEMTGTISPYRRKWIHKYNSALLKLGMHNTLDMVKVRSFGDENKHLRRPAAFSLHPPQTAKWPYSSPMRLFRSLQTDGAIPVITKRFSQNPIEDVCLEYDGFDTLKQLADMYSDPEKKTHFIEERIVRYNMIVMPRNQSWFAQIIALAKS